MNTYTKGSQVRVRFYFRDENNDPQDPGSVFFTYRREEDDPVSYEYGVGTDIVRASVGSYYVLIAADIVGLYRTRGYSTGPGKAADEDSFRVTTDL